LVEADELEEGGGRRDPRRGHDLGGERRLLGEERRGRPGPGVVAALLSWKGG